MKNQTKSKLKLSIEPGGWFVCYLGYIYANTPTEINDRINNKAIIEKLPPLPIKAA